MPAGFPFTMSLAKYIIESYVGMRIAPTNLGFETPVNFKVIKTDAIQDEFTFEFETPVNFKVIKTRIQPRTSRAMFETPVNFMVIKTKWLLRGGDCRV